MKYFMHFLLFLIMMLLHHFPKAQDASNPAPRHKHYPDEQKWKAQAEISCNCDTLTISVPTTLKFIKIGDDVYQIVQHNATIEKVQPAKTFRLWDNGVFGFPNSTNTIFPSETKTEPQ